jgi:hypothetical protein
MKRLLTRLEELAPVCFCLLVAALGVVLELGRTC